MELLFGAETAFAAYLVSLVPVLVWLTFWLFEDWKKPEPRFLLFLAFAAGMLAVLIVLPIEALAAHYFSVGLSLIFIWAAIEELAKFGIAWLVVLRRNTTDEPIDLPLYLITVALGFASLENAFFLFNPVSGGRVLESVTTGDLRFIGATLIHVLCSSIIGGALAFAYYRERSAKIIFGVAGVILALLLHTLFNSLIILRGAGSALTVFLGVWVGIVFLLLAFERIKRILRPAWWEKTFVDQNA